LFDAPGEGTLCDISVTYTPLKSSVANNTGLCSFVRMGNPAKLNKIGDYNRSRSSKVIDFGVNQKSICDFLLVINSNLGHISYRFRDIDV